MAAVIGVEAAERIVSAAAEVLADRGFHGLSISAVARQAGVSRPTVYAYFASKEELISQVLHDVSTQVAVRVVREAERATTAADFAVEIMIAMRREFRTQPALAPLAFPQLGSTIFDGDPIGPDAIKLSLGFLGPLVDLQPDLAADLDEIAETMIRTLFSLIMFESRTSASDSRLRAYLHRRMVPALGIRPVSAG